MNAPTDTADRVRKLIAEHLGKDESECVDAAYLGDDLGADTLDRLKLVMAFEESFGMEITDEDEQGVLTVADAIAVVGKALA